MSDRTILVIEDNAMNMKLIRALLGVGNYRVMEADDAETGIEMARRQSPDLILMDIQLPGMDGLHATRIIKSDPDLSHIPVIAITSYAMQSDENDAKKAGCIGYITKPINTRTFLCVIGQHLES
jgi:CheY-like chemotaxis protein